MVVAREPVGMVLLHGKRHIVKPATSSCVNIGCLWIVLAWIMCLVGVHVVMDDVPTRIMYDVS